MSVFDSYEEYKILKNLFAERVEKLPENQKEMGKKEMKDYFENLEEYAKEEAKQKNGIDAKDLLIGEIVLLKEGSVNSFFAFPKKERDEINKNYKKNSILVYIDEKK